MSDSHFGSVGIPRKTESVGDAEKGKVDSRCEKISCAWCMLTSLMMLPDVSCFEAVEIWKRATE